MTTLFSPFGISWVIRSSIRETLLGWHDYFFGRKWKKVWGVAPLCFFFFDNLEREKQKIVLECRAL